MPGFFEALSNLPPIPTKKLFVNVAGQEYEVTLEKKKWAIQHGEENRMIKDGEIVVKPTPKPKTRYSVLKKATKGYTFHDNDIHWPNKIVEGGVTWQIESE
jgi:hypothetical protein